MNVICKMIGLNQVVVVAR